MINLHCREAESSCNLQSAICKLIINATIVTVNPGMEVITKGSILIENGVITAVTAGELTKEGAEVVDAGGMIVMPGLINTHTHLPMTLLRGYADDLPLHTWLNDYIFPAEARILTPENVRIGTRLALLEMIKTGTSCFNDMYFFDHEIAEEAQYAGLRGVVGESLIDFPTASYATVAEGVKLIEALMERWQDNGLIYPVVCAHSPYTCSAETLRIAKQLADKYETPLHIHLSETQKEVEDVTKKTGYSPVSYLKKLGLLDKNLLAAHAVWFSGEEAESFAAAGASVAHCPKSNLKLGSGIADIAAYLRMGINVGIGTDGTASNNVLDMVEELRFASLLPKGHHLDAALVTAEQTIRMATINGARALGLEQLTGSIEVGKKADLIFIDSNRYNINPVYNIYAALVYAMNSRDICHLMVNGKWLMRNRVVLTLSEAEVLEEMAVAAEKIKKLS